MDPNVATPAPAGSPATSTAGSTNVESPVAPDTKQLAETVAAVLKRLDSQSAIINRLEKGIKPVEQKPAEPKPGETPAAVEPKANDLTARVQQLEDRDKALNERDARVKKNAVVTNINAKLREQGVDENAANRFAKMIYDENAKNIVVEEKEDGSLVPKIKDGENSHDLGKWMDAYFQTNDGRALLPPVKNPKSLPGGPAPVIVGKTNVSKSDVAAGKFDPKIMSAGGYNVVD